LPLLKAVGGLLGKGRIFLMLTLLLALNVIYN